MGWREGRTSSRGGAWRSVVLLALVPALFLAHRSLDRRDPERDRDRALHATTPREETRIPHLPEIIDDSVRIRSKPPAPLAGMMGMLLEHEAALRETPQYRAAYQQGRAEAEAQLKEEKATLYTFGAGMTAEYLDFETGLHRQYIGGCMPDATILGRMDGHNRRIEESIKARGLPANSFKRWAKELSDLPEYFALCRRTEEPRRLIPGGRVLKSPDGAFTVRAVDWPAARPDGSRGGGLGIVIGGPGSERPPAHVHYDNGCSELVWGPEGSGFAVIRCRGPERDGYMALDLRTGTWLRCESEDDGTDPRIYDGDPPPLPPQAGLWDR